MTVRDKKRKVPKLRFPGFEGEWEQRKAAEIAEFSKGNGYSKSDLTETGTPIILYGRLYTKYQFTIDEVDTFAEPKSGAVYSQGNEVIIPASGETAEDIARASAVIRSGVLLGGDLNILRPFDFINSQFLALAISSGEPQKELAQKAQGKSVVHIHNSDIQEIVIFCPTKAEQNRIVDVFRNFDHLITLHQRKLTHLQQKKKGLLQKMFPRDGERVPELRFLGFTDAWEQRKLNEITDVRDGTHASPKYFEQGHPFVTSKNVGGGFINYNDIQYISDEDFEEINKRSKVDIKDILMGMIGTIGNIALIRTEPDFAIKNVALIKDTKQVDYLYIYHYLQSTNVEKQLASSMDGGTQKFIALGKIRDLDILLPSKQEQADLGTFMRELDHLITLHQRKLDHLHLQKKALLQQMFV